LKNILILHFTRFKKNNGEQQPTSPFHYDNKLKKLARDKAIDKIKIIMNSTIDEINMIQNFKKMGILGNFP
jgi:hypothetical protein